MHPLLANTIWAPIFVYWYSWPWAWTATVVGFFAEYGVFRLYTRSLLPRRVTFRRLLIANLGSYFIGQVLILFMPLRFHKVSLVETVQGFGIAYLITLLIEFLFLRSLLPGHRSLLVRAVIMCNFVSYAILFAAFIFWFGAWHLLLRKLTGNT